MSDESKGPTVSSSCIPNVTPTSVSTSPAVSKICSTCDDLFHVRRFARYKIELVYHHHTIANLEKSAQNCEVCALFQAQITESKLVEGKEHIDEPLCCYMPPSTLHFWNIGLHLGTIEDPTSVKVSELILINIPNTKAPELDENRNTNTDSPETIALAQKWLQSCREFHDECVPTAEHAGSRPSRILSIGLSDSSPIHLHTQHLPPDIPYATLSHCWGGHHAICLTEKNFASYTTSIPFSCLPKTFGDAIKVARQLGFAYIWIDSLCIIQGDHEDWYNESSRMSNIYGGSGLNIAASGAHHSDEGLFFERELALARRLLVYADPRTSEEPRDPARDSRDNAERKLFYACRGDLYGHCFKDQPISSRAWVFQERYLAPRTLHFGNSQIFWECHESGCAFETLPWGMPTDLLIPDDMALQWERWKGFEDNWRAVVREYSQGKLTRGSDKIVAISGVARAFRARYGGHYYHGLWSEHFPRNLGWTGDRRVSRRWIRPGTLPQEPGREKRAPTWSWVSVDGPIWLRGSSMKSTSCTVIKIEGPDDPYSHDPDGLITLEVERLLEVTQLTHYTVAYDWGVDHFTASVTGVGDTPWAIRCTFDHYDEDGGFLIPRKFYMLDMIERYEGAGTGILVCPVKGKKGVFTRLGIYTTSGKTFTAFQEARWRSLEDEESEMELYERRGETKEDGTQTFVLTLE